MMTADKPNEKQTQNDTIGEQLNELGRNLRQVLQSAWESEERRKLQQEIEVGLANLGESLSEAARDFSNSPAGKSLKEDVKDIQERWQSGEMQSKVQNDVMDALRKVNTELQKATQKNPPPPADKPQA
jgi:vacuolar-type H+-ATPase subunit E/Vma4